MSMINKGIPAVEVKKFVQTGDLAELGPGPRVGVRPAKELEEGLAEALAQSGVSGTKARLVRALILLWHDHLDASHKIAQEIEDADGSFIHGIMHRREPDYGNAKYWFHRVGKHPAYPEIAKRVQDKVWTHGREIVQQLIPKGEWDPFAFVDMCEEASEGKADENVLREVQRIETEVLLEKFVQSQ